MPINAYVGWPGAGKSYQVVANVIIPQIAKGRSVVTNIDGIDVDAVYENIFCQNRGNIVCLGSLRTITNEDVESPHLFPRDFTDREWKKYQTSKSWQTYIAFRKECGLPPLSDFTPLINPGEMIIIDEAANWWGNDCSIIPEHGKFFREHRHHVDAYTHESCDLVIIVQEITDIKRSLRSLIQYTFRAEKLDTVGLDKRYKLHMYRGAKISDRIQPLRSELGQYKPEIYECYSSYAGGKGKEKSIDGRHNVLNDKKLKYKALTMLVAFLVLGIFAYYQLKKVFGNKDQVTVKVDSNIAAKDTEKMSFPPPPQVPQVSPGWRVMGWYKVGDILTFIVEGDGGKRRYIHQPKKYVVATRGSEVEVDGVMATEYSGSNASPLGVSK